MKDNWKIKTLDELFNIKSSKRVHKADWKSEGIPFYRAREVVRLSKEGAVDNDLFISEELYNDFIKVTGSPKEGDIIISAVGTLGQCYLVKKADKFYFKDASVLWFEKKSNINTRYIEYAFKSDLILKQVLNKSMGATVGTLTISRAKIIEIPIPPIEEQKEIIEILDQAFESIDKAKANIEKNIENAKELFESRQKKYFDELSENLVLTPILEACEKIFAGGDKPKDYFSKTKTSDYQIPVISNGEKNDGLYGFTKTPKVTKPSVTVSARGTIGFTVFRNYPFVPIVRLIVLTPNEDIIIPEFLMRVLKTLDILRTGSSIPQLTVPMIKTYSIPVPDLEKQKEIVETLDIIDNHIQSLLATYEEELKNLEDLKKSILQKAFSGELTNKNKAA